ncbi:MAG: fatty-acyl-CoA synthase, partial [Clostridiales bacterium]|nr:fatty-acyl-CoA synthase [Clostridiales bacterium]
MELKEMTVGQLLSRNAEQFPDTLAMEYHEWSYTWQDMNRITEHLAVKFYQDGIRKGVHVGIFCSNSPNWVFTYLALAKLGAISVLINFNYKEKELHAVLNYANIEYLCYGDHYKENDFKEIMRKLRKRQIWKMRRYIYMGPDEEGQWFHENSFFFENPKEIEGIEAEKGKVGTHDILSMLFTSGTTSQPKGILLTHYQMLNIAAIACDSMHWKREDKICLSLALFHCFGLSTGLLASLVSGCSICVIESFRTIQVLQEIQEKKCTVLSGVPTMFLAMMKNEMFSSFDLSSLVSGIIAGSGIRKCDYRNIVERFQMKKLQQSFGQTEASPSITFSDYEDPMETKEVSVGKAIPHTKLRIMDNRRRLELNPYEIGEIQVQGFHVMQYGYYKKKTETKRTFSADGWLRTGDLGYLDEEGNLYITGRKKDIIIRCGENIAPLELEEVFLQYKGVLDVKVFGVPDPFAQEEIAAAVCYSKT